MEPVAAKVELNRQIQTVSHEINVAQDGLGRHFEVEGHLRTIREPVALEALVNAEHPRQRRARHA